MSPLSRILSLAAAGAFVALTADSIPARADELTPEPGTSRASRAHSHDGWQ